MLILVAGLRLRFRLLNQHLLSVPIIDRLEDVWLIQSSGSMLLEITFGLLDRACYLTIGFFISVCRLWPKLVRHVIVSDAGRAFGLALDHPR